MDTAQTARINPNVGAVFRLVLFGSFWESCITEKYPNTLYYFVGSRVCARVLFSNGNVFCMSLSVCVRTFIGCFFNVHAPCTLIRFDWIFQMVSAAKFSHMPLHLSLFLACTHTCLSGYRANLDCSIHNSTHRYFVPL